MHRIGLPTSLVIGGVIAAAAPLAGQGYHVRWDSRLQTVGYRGLQDSSVAVGDVVTGADGGLYSPDGFAVRCAPGASQCTYFHPGDVRRAMPVVSTLDAAVWGFGVKGLTLRTRLRAGTDLKDPALWPGVEPPVQLLEGYAEYVNGPVTAEAGRTYTVSRLGFTGLDGGRVHFRGLRGRVAVSAFGGWGFARAAPLALGSPEVNPLNDFQPTERQRIVGGSAGWTLGRFEGRVLYQRTMDGLRQNASDPRATYEPTLVSERGAVDAAFRPSDALTIVGGAEYDISRQELGTADLRAHWQGMDGRVELTAGARHYRPYFDVWTIWGVFAPVPYVSGFGSARVRALPGVHLWTRGERYAYDDADAESVLTRVEDQGWRWSVGATVTRFDRWALDAGYHLESGVGASALGVDGRVSYRPSETLTVMAHGGYRDRPLEYRFSEARLLTLGLQADVEVMPGLRVTGGATYWDELRDREDAAAIDWTQIRAHVGVTLAFGSADRASLHPAILRMPEGDAR